LIRNLFVAGIDEQVVEAAMREHDALFQLPVDPPSSSVAATKSVFGT